MKTGIQANHSTSVHLNNPPVVRGAYADANIWPAGGYIARDTWSGGGMDAPEYMPQGCMRNSGTRREHAVQALAHREWDTGFLPLGCGHDGPTTAGYYWPAE